MDLVGRRSAEPRLLASLIDKAKRNQRRPIDRASHIQPVIELIICNRLLCYRSEHAINRLREIAELLQRVLHVGDDLVRRQTIIPIDRPIVMYSSNYRNRNRKPDTNTPGPTRKTRRRLK